jgi:hypothetical protein
LLELALIKIGVAIMRVFHRHSRPTG